jgi:serine/threonine protein kinase
MENLEDFFLDHRTKPFTENNVYHLQAIKRDELSEFRIQLNGKFLRHLHGNQGHGMLYECPDHKLHVVKPVRVTPANRTFFDQEIKTFAKLKHPCILGFQGFVLNERLKEAKIMTEFMPNGTLEDIITAEKRISPTKRAKIVCGIVLGMRFMHSKGVIHRNLKSLNIYLDGLWRPRIGSSYFLTYDESLPEHVETTRYMAPECFEERGSTKMMDVYSFGLILYEILVGRSVFSRGKSVDEVRKLIREGNRAEIPQTVPRNVRKLIKRCWSQNPEQRPTFEEVFGHLNDMDFQIVSGVKPEKIIQFIAEID